MRQLAYPVCIHPLVPEHYCPSPHLTAHFHTRSLFARHSPPAFAEVPGFGVLGTLLRSLLPNRPVSGAPTPHKYLQPSVGAFLSPSVPFLPHPQRTAQRLHRTAGRFLCIHSPGGRCAVAVLGRLTRFDCAFPLTMYVHLRQLVDRTRLSPCSPCTFLLSCAKHFTQRYLA